MLDLLWLVPTFPLAGFLLVGLFPLPRAAITVVGVGSVGLSAITATLVAIVFMQSPPAAQVYTQTLATWLVVEQLKPTFTLYLDGLSLVMVLVVTWVSFLIHLYASGFMAGDPGYRRFFAYMNLFVAAMLILVLADNLVFFYLGWEGVGLCSYLLIGFWYQDPANGRAARKAFIITRIGDVALIIGLFLLFTQFGTLTIQTLLERSAETGSAGSGWAVAVTLLLLGGAVGKSAQLPLQTWLPDAMAGPTPVSALIHAATMVTAGVYLIARTHPLYTLTPAVQTVVAVIGTATLVLASISALVQSDIKRILAYSTISQIGYMFLALGMGAWSAAIFHLMTHAFFKALLFMAAGVVILHLEGEHNIFKMGGLRRRLPLAFWGFLIGACSLSALPLVTAGFYSKDRILLETAQAGAWGLWSSALLGTLITALYSFRPLFIAFFGEAKPRLQKKPGPSFQLGFPIVVLAILAIAGGFIPLPQDSSLPAPEPAGRGLVVPIVTSLVSILGIFLAYWLFFHDQAPDSALNRIKKPLTKAGWVSLADRGWGFDDLYHTLLVAPFLFLANQNRRDVIDRGYQRLSQLCRELHDLLSRTQNGRLRWYAAGLTGGSILVIALTVWL